jgi:hypothetical protein
MYYGQLKNLSSRTSFSTRRTIRPREACKITAIFYGLLTLIFIILTFTCYIIKNIILNCSTQWLTHHLDLWALSHDHFGGDCIGCCSGGATSWHVRASARACPVVHSWVCVATRHHSCLAFVTCGDRIVASAVAQRGWGVSVVAGGMTECICG